MTGTEEFNPTFRDGREAFENAISAGALSETEGARNFVHDFMYMHTEHAGTGREVDAFKHIDTRAYIRVPHRGGYMDRDRRQTLIHLTICCAALWGVLALAWAAA